LEVGDDDDDDSEIEATRAQPQQSPRLARIREDPQVPIGVADAVLPMPLPGVTEAAKPKVPHRLKPGTLALQELRARQQQQQQQPQQQPQPQPQPQAGPPTLIRQAAFARIVCDITSTIDTSIVYQSSAVKALQEAVEAYMIGFFEDVNSMAVHDRRLTISEDDVVNVAHASGIRRLGRGIYRRASTLTPMPSSSSSSPAESLSMAFTFTAPTASGL
jgi:histone H3/H4